MPRQSNNDRIERRWFRIVFAWLSTAFVAAFSIVIGCPAAYSRIAPN